jgi:hypothetical protein
MLKKSADSFLIPVSPNMLAVAQAAAEQAETENEQGHCDV